jgi:hypothetical protein
MSEAPQPGDRVAALLDRLIDMDMAAAEHVNAQLLAATEPAEVASLSRAYNRCSRSARQVLMLRMRYDKERAEAEARARRDAEHSPLDRKSALDRLIDRRSADLQDAVARVAAAAHPDKPRLQRDALDRLDYEIDLWLDSDDCDFIDEPLDELVVQACQRAGLPLALARQWETLPRPGQTFDPAETPPPLADTG